MRRTALILLAATLFAGSVQASDYEPIFGRATCGAAFSCMAGMKNGLDINKVIATANSCVSQNFGFVSSSSLFLDEMGLNGSNCLTAKPPVAKSERGRTMTPRCCIVPAKVSGTCQVSCELYGIR